MLRENRVLIKIKYAPFVFNCHTFRVVAYVGRRMNSNRIKDEGFRQITLALSRNTTLTSIE